MLLTSHAAIHPQHGGVQADLSPACLDRVGTTAQGLLSYFGIMKIPVQYEIIEHELNQTTGNEGANGSCSFQGWLYFEKE